MGRPFLNEANLSGIEEQASTANREERQGHSRRGTVCTETQRWSTDGVH